MPNESFPMQPIVLVDGTPRFKENRIVRYLLDAGPFDLHMLALMSFTDEERAQFAQLIGYSVSGFGDLSYASRDTVDKADAVANELLGVTDRRVIRVVVPCFNASGEPDLYYVKVQAAPHQIDEGEHYEAALEAAMRAGFEGIDEGSVAFDEDDHAGQALMGLVDWELASVVDADGNAL